MRWANPFFKVFGKTPPPVPTTRRVPDGTRVYCVGDIHGRDDLLREMAERVKADMEGSVVRPCRDGFPGRLCRSRSWLHARGRATCTQRMANPHDRPGRQSRGSSDGLPGRRTGPRCLAKLGRARDPAFLWGGCRPGHGWTRFCEQFKRHSRPVFPNAIGTSSKRLRLQRLSAITSFCHAGVRPGVPLDRQDRNDLLNIRDPFLSSEAEHGKLVVHGHTPSVAPEIRPNRIGIDTGRLCDRPPDLPCFGKRPAAFPARGRDDAVTYQRGA